MGYIRRRETSRGIRYYPCIGNHTYGGFDRKKDAEAKLRYIEARIASGKHEIPTVGFSDFADRWLAYKRNMVRTSSFAAYAAQTVHLKKILRNTPLALIGPNTASQLTAELMEKYQPRTVNLNLTVLKNILAYAVTLGLLESVPRIEMVRVPRTEARFLNSEEIAALLQTRRRDLYLTALLTGMRVGELVALRWTDYDGKNITVTRTYGKFGYGPPKSGRPRTVHVSPELRKVLDSRDRRFDLIFSETGGPLTTASKDYPGPGTFHSLRHTYAALMLAAGVSPKYLQEQMGHASIQTTLDLYGHLVPEIHAGSLAKLDALVLDSRVVRLERRAGDGQG